MKKTPTFDQLITALGTAHETLLVQAVRAVNTGLTLRNWLFGFYIETHERGGVDRQQYGDKLLDKLAQTLAGQGVPRSDRRELYRYRQFYLAYPNIVESLSPQLQKTVSLLAPTHTNQIVESVTRELVLLYWQIGRDILERQVKQGWGAKVIERLGHDLRTAFPDMKGFSRANLMYMRAFGQAWPTSKLSNRQLDNCLGVITWCCTRGAERCPQSGV